MIYSNNTSNINWKPYVSALFAYLILMTSCSEKDEFYPNEIVGDADAFFVMDYINAGESTFDAQSDFVHFTQAFSSIHIPANSLVDTEGMIVQGQVEVIFSEVKSNGEMILNQWTSRKSDGLYAIESYFYIEFSQNGQQVYIDDNKPLIVRIRDNNTLSNFDLYQNDILTSFNNSDKPWSQSSDNVRAAEWSFYWAGKDWANEGYEIDIRETGSYAVAGILASSSESKVELCVDLPVEIYNSDNSVVYASIKGEGSVVHLSYDSEKMLFCTPFYDSMRGSELSIISISNRNDETFYFGTTHAVIGEDGIIQIVPESKTREEILDALSIL